MLGAVVFGHEQMQVAIKAIQELAAEVGKPSWDWQAAGAGRGARLRPWPRTREAAVGEAYRITEKQAALRARRRDQGGSRSPRSPRARRRSSTADEVDDELVQAREQHRARAHPRGEPRIDGRDTKTVRPITRARSACCRARTARRCSRAARRRRWSRRTLGTGRDAQIIDALEGERREPFMLHYNFPPFSVGETGMMGSPKRREIGHGNLAERGVERRDAGHESFPYIDPRRLGDPRVERLELDGDASAAPAWR